MMKQAKHLAHMSAAAAADADADGDAAATSAAGQLRELTMRISHLLHVDPRKAALMGSSLEEEVFKYGEMGMLLHVAAGVVGFCFRVCAWLQVWWGFAAHSQSTGYRCQLCISSSRR
jgi:hypothetical protein